ncbi:sugar ABC transporter [Rhizobium sp. Leaf306]|uniref:sugar ABC transporter ATP-binding protein n=1 Tax=Rhizobium sp. Leaf306 TaxID=1736330 RepID=UPI00071250FF|nr:sugar ABC transporter ATP-binding protein [Rhizobium sp. Leaf306]KQQ35690.1 sugar ABC transporter [Rhizobium sp. Leaf306]
MTQQSNLAINMHGISKSFGPIKALVDANLQVERGSIHGLVGQNGAGKSTIIKALAGMLKPDAGSIEINGKTVTRLTPANIERLGVHFIHQDRLLVPTATIGEAIFLRNEPGFGIFVNHRKMARRARELLKQYFDLDLPAGTLIQDLTTAQQKIVQITRALAQNASVLVLDEPTAALVKREVVSLFNVLRRLKQDGIAVIFISHYMQEIEDICDTVTVMRNGTDVGVVSPKTTSIDEIVRMMINRDVGEMFPKRTVAVGETVLNVSNLSREGHFDDISFDIKAGEVVGITGLLGSGVKELIHCLFGLAKPDSGAFTIDGTATNFSSPVSAVSRNVALVPEDRRAHGVALSLSVRENISIASLDRYSRNGFVTPGPEKSAVDGFIRELSIKTPHRDALVRTLSGGNQQKVALAKWLSCQSKLYVLDEPTVAVDVGAKIEIYTLLNRLAAEGAAILFMSSDLLELVGICDRVLVVYRGELTHEFQAGDVDSDRLLAAASGARSQTGRAAA